MLKSPFLRSRWVSPALALALLALTIAALLTRFGALPAGSPESVERCLQRLEIGRALYTHAQGASVPLVQLLVAPDRETRVPLYQRIDAANAAAEKAVLELEGLSVKPDERQRLAGLIAARQAYDQRYTAAVEEIELAGTKGALDQFWAATRDALKELETFSARLVEEESQRLAQERAALAAAENERRWTLLLFVLALLLAAWAGAAAFKLRRP
ncbi:hypothetical protein BURK2_00544 [Burkholderiales bacterium]|nr:hypothetical protein BURK2_00544 [Burkholderiales bacterium]